jgi:sodium/potassium-transporting ATPase subunit alpha
MPFGVEHHPDDRSLTGPATLSGPRDDLRSVIKYTEHAMSLSQLSEAFGTDLNEKDPNMSLGLTAMTCNSRLNAHGRNAISPPPTTPRWMLFLLQFTDTFMVLLQFASFLSLLSWCLEEQPRDPVDLYIGLFLIVVVIFQCTSTFWQEAKSDELMEKFRALAPQFSICIREGVQLRIPSEDLVVGDLVKLSTGVKVPADCRLIYIAPGNLFRVDQSSITGESEPVECNCRVSSERSAFDGHNIAFSGSLVVEGDALAVIVRAGDRTLLGDMVRMTNDLGKQAGTLKEDVGDFVWVLSKIAVGMGVVIFLCGIYRGLPILETLIDGFIGIIEALTIFILKVYSFHAIVCHHFSHYYRQPALRPPGHGDGVPAHRRGENARTERVRQEARLH